MKIFDIAKKDILKIVSNSQQIEGYKSASKSLAQKAKEFMAKHNVQVSA
jgi:hypothetical protein